MTLESQIEALMSEAESGYDSLDGAFDENERLLPILRKFETALEIACRKLTELDEGMPWIEASTTGSVSVDVHRERLSIESTLTNISAILERTTHAEG